LRCQQAHVPDDNHAFLVHHNGLPEAELPNAPGYFVYSTLRDVPGVPGVRNQALIGQISTFMSPDDGRRTNSELTITVN
jgi:hypothetical protein